MKKTKYLSLLNIAILTLGVLIGCSSNTPKVLVSLDTEGPGEIELKGVDQNNYASLNETITISPLPNKDCYLKSVFLNEEDITSSLSFVITDTDINYEIHTTFTTYNSAYSISLSGPSLLEVGTETQLKTTITGPDQDYFYISSNDDIATVSNDGVLHGKKPGFAVITASATNSSKIDPTTSSLPVFIAPSYFKAFTDSFDDYSIEGKGLKLQGQLDFNYSPKDATDPSASALLFPYEINIQADEEYLFKVDFSLIFGENTSTITNLLKTVTGNSEMENIYKAGLCLSGINELSLYLKDKNDQYILYKKVDSLYMIIRNLVEKLHDTSLDSEDGILSDPTVKTLINAIKSGRFEEMFQLLNSFLCVGNTPEEGIYVRQAYIYTLRSALVSLQDLAIEQVKKLTDNELYQSIATSLIKQLFPTKLQDIRLTFALDENQKFKNLAFTIKDEKSLSNGSTKVPTVYPYLNLTYLQDKDGVSDGYFTTLDSQFIQANKDNEHINLAADAQQIAENDVTSSKKLETVSSTILTKNYSIYETIQNNKNFNVDLYKYLDLKKQLQDPSSPNYVVNKTLLNGHDFGVLTTYASYKVSKQDDSSSTALEDEYICKVGDKFVLSDFKAIGTNLEDPTINKEDITFSLAKNSGYFTFDQTTNVLTYTKAPTKDVVITLSSSTSKYSSVTYRFILKAA